MGIAIIALLVLVVVAVVGVPILMRVFGEAARRNPNRPGGPGDDSDHDEDSGRE